MLAASPGLFGSCWLRRSAQRLAIVAALALVALLDAGHSSALGVIAAGSHTPIEQRVALAVGPTESILWTQLRLDAAAGPVALVVPAPPGARLDWSSPAWFEALEIATAPRILPPDGLEPTCPGEGGGTALHVAGETGHTEPLVPLEVAVMTTSGDVVSWAQQHGMTVGSGLADALASLTEQRFVVARFEAPGGSVLTPTLRIVQPSASTELPLVLTRATSDELLVTSWQIGAGRAGFVAAPHATIDSADLWFDAATAESSYAEARADALSLLGPTGVLLEATGHNPFSTDVAIAEGEATIDAVVGSFFDRAAAYGDGDPDSATCIMQATAVLSSSSTLAHACPREDLGVVESADPCVEVVAPGEIDPELLRCGAGADDLAVALSGQVPAWSWLTRHSLLVPAGSGGTVMTIEFPGGTTLLPVWTASSLDYSGCGGAGGGGGSGGGTGTGTATGTSTGTSTGTTTGTGTGTATGTPSGSPGAGPHIVTVPVYAMDTSCGRDSVGAFLYFVEVLVEEGEADPEIVYEEEGCSGDTSYSYEYEGDEEPDGYEFVEEDDEMYYVYDDYEEDDGCSGDSSSSSDSCSGDSSDSSSGDGCSGETSDSSSDSSDGCSGDSSDSSSDSDSSCSGDSSDSSSDSGCSGGGGSSSSSDSDCVIGSRKRLGRPRLSVMVFWAVFLLAPLRRAWRRSWRRAGLGHARRRR